MFFLTDIHLEKSRREKENQNFIFFITYQIFTKYNCMKRNFTIKNFSALSRSVRRGVGVAVFGLGLLSSFTTIAQDQSKMKANPKEYVFFGGDSLKGFDIQAAYQ